MEWELLDKIDFTKVFAQERDYFKRYKRINPQKQFLESIIKECTKLDNNIYTNLKTTKTVFYKSMTRADYDLLLDKIAGTTDNPIIDLRQTSNSLNGELIRYIKKNYHHSKIVRENNPYLNQALRIKLLTYCFLFSKTFKNTNRAIFFSDMQGAENFFCQALKLCKIPTATLQHGLYVEYFDDDNINIVNYKNHVADFFLAWGDCTANLIHKYRPDSKILVVGKPTLEPKTFNNQSSETGRILIATDQKLFDQQNIDMISIVLSAIPKELQKIVIKLHPSNEKAMYTAKFPKVKFIEKVPEDISLVVGHTTSLLYEMLSQGYKVLRYRTEVESIYFPPEAEFDSEDRFKKARGSASSNETNKGSKYYIKYLGQESLDHYKNFLDYFDRT
ncbi:hypothetical protein [Gilvimarinus japonicus]|uniref:Uncharacterized protein n=1 Tax=Gilvimarinus japonicus TaxID=1796469 RepID=A0ABV7HVE1_9GAMM